MFPKSELEINPYNTTALWRSSLDDQDLPDNVLKDIQPLKLDVRPGDVVLFRGSSIYHEREKPAFIFKI